MHRVYEIFEVLPAGSRHSVAVVSGLESAKLRLHDFASHTRNECYAADVNTRQIVAYDNISPAEWRRFKRIFVICYDEQLGLRRAEILSSYGYHSSFIIGNQAAKVLLTPAEHYDLFMVGPAAPRETRQEIVDWLKAKYPRAKILALNPPNQQLSGANHNVLQDVPETWLPIVHRELASLADGPGPDKGSTAAG